VQRWKRKCTAPVVALISIGALGAPASARADMQSARQGAGQAVEAMISSSGDASLTRFIDGYLSTEYQQSLAKEDLLALLRKIRGSCAAAGGIMAEPIGDDGLRLVFEGGQESYTVEFRIQKKPPYKITELTWIKGTAADMKPRKKAMTKTITWNSLEQSLKDEEKKGFAGAVLVVRDGDVVLHDGYGMANRERGTPNTRDTIFAIGSTPIDFTKAAILKLEEMGRLQTSDPITKFLANVPDDKKTITIDHLMTGRSGLANFHHVPGQDEDYDLTWIDRATAIERMLGKELLFPPGEGEAHSHSAWGLLAAIVEIVSGQSYEEFLQQCFFTPAGMTHTGLYQATPRFDENELAVGYGLQKVGKINSPRYWGKTSWLVKGSGGMVSNPGNLYQWVQAIRTGKTLSAKAAEKYWSGGVLAGGNDRGFFCLYTEGPGNMVFLCANAHTDMNDCTKALADGLARLVMSGR